MAEVIPVLNVKWISIRLQKQCKHTNRKSFASLNDRTFWFSSECFTASSQKTSHTHTHTHTHTRTWMHKHQWCSLLLVSGHRLKKKQPRLFPPPSGPWSDWHTVLVVLCPVYSLWCHRQACYSFPTKFKPQVSAEYKCVNKCIWSAGAPCFGWSKQPCSL